MALFSRPRPLRPSILLIAALSVTASGPGFSAEESAETGGEVSETSALDDAKADPLAATDEPGLTTTPSIADPLDPEVESVLPEGESDTDLPDADDVELLPPEGVDSGAADLLLDDLGFEEDPLTADPEGPTSQDLDVDWGPIGIGQSARSTPDFDVGIRENELLLGGFRPPLETQGFRFGLGSQFIYDSNLFLDTFNARSDFSFVVSPSIDFRSAPEGVPGLFTFSYTPFVRSYFSETDLNTIDHSANAALSFNGSRGRFQLSTNYGRFSNANRFVGGRVETETFSVGASGAYQLAPRTSLEASLSASASDDSQVVQPGNAAVLPNNRNDIFQAQVATYWQATPKTRLGPSLRYSASSSDSIGDRESLAFLLVADFVPSERLSVYASAGIERVSNDLALRQDSTDFTGSFGFNYRPNDRFVLGADLRYQAIPVQSNRVSRSGGGDRSLTGGLSLSYLPNPNWSFEIGVTGDAFPSADAANYSVGDLEYRATVARTLGEGSLALTGSWGFSEYDPVGNVIVVRSDDEFRSLSLAYRLPVFAGRGQLDSSIQWSDSSGQRDWDRLQVMAGLSYGF